MKRDNKKRQKRDKKEMKKEITTYSKLSHTKIAKWRRSVLYTGIPY